MLLYIFESEAASLIHHASDERRSWKSCITTRARSHARRHMQHDITASSTDHIIETCEELLQMVRSCFCPLCCHLFTHIFSRVNFIPNRTRYLLR